MKTLNSKLPSAEICRRNGWGSGDVLSGTNEYGEAQIVLTAVGVKNVLAMPIMSMGKVIPHFCVRYEGVWDLTHREWKKVE